MGILPWQRPPTWLYLPNQGVHGHGHTEQIDEGTDALADGCTGAQGVAIRGRLPTPGRGGQGAETTQGIGDDATRSGANIAEGVEAPAGEAAADNTRGGGRRGASSTKGADAYIMDAYLERHRDRVKRRLEMDRLDGNQPAATAAERMAALRRRIAERRAAASHSTAADYLDRVTETDRADPVAEAPRRACTKSPGAPTSTEDDKIHLSLGDGIQGDPAWRRGSATVTADGGGTNGAAAAEASRVAWHSLDTAVSAPP